MLLTIDRRRVLAQPSMPEIMIVSDSVSREPFAPSVTRKRHKGCRNCVTCRTVGLQLEQIMILKQLATASQGPNTWGNSTAGDPMAYFSSKNNEILQKAPFAVWRSSDSSTAQETSNLLQRRGHAPLSVNLPSSYTNIKESGTRALYLGSLDLGPLAPTPRLWPGFRAAVINYNKLDCSSESSFSSSDLHTC